MNIDNHVIETIEELEAFLHLVESGALGLEGVTGVALATSNTDGRPFVAVLGEKHQLLLGRKRHRGGRCGDGKRLQCMVQCRGSRRCEFNKNW